MEDEEIKKLLDKETDPYKIAYLLWLLYGDLYFSSAEQNGAYY